MTFGRPGGQSRSRTGSSPAKRAGGRSGGGFGQEPPPGPSAETDREPDHESIARAIGLRMLAGAPRSRAELAAAMARKDVPSEVSDAVLDRFTEVGLLDDAEYARMLVRTRQGERGLARRAIGAELRRRGVDDEVAGEALGEVDDEDEERAARALVRRRLVATRGLDAQTRTRRIFAALGRRGYGGTLISRLVREELAAEGVEADDLDSGLDSL
ncbi:regulatory protein RecX [Cellulomonas sp. WB94]|uniref:regulatory protein RecX n=1 Tax=Cellulomonas sp. WB94 TaxID=2173174 RepID=UPI001F5B27A0|nr:regulatory protein RecX [Cellulomonas sp. WB94]